ncbi:MAG: MarR family winged helix-turn-helix transcriptional regulator [Evtepia sp.]
MQTLENPSLNITQFMCVMNLLHRIAIRQLPDALLQGMTVSQLAAIGFLFFQEEKDLYQRDLESFFKLRRSTISSLLNTLEKKELIQRRSVPHDARLKKLVLTPQGRQVGSQVHQLFTGLNQRMVRGLSQEEMDTMRSILRKIEQNLCSEEL